MVAYLASDDAAAISGHLFKLAADGEIGLWSIPQVVTTIKTADASWSLSDLRERVPDELLKDATTIVTAIPTGQR